MKSIHSKTIVFIHGNFVHYSGWKPWQDYFESKGYKTLAPPWPYKDAPVEVLRSQHPNSKIATLHLTDLIHHYTEIIKQLPEKPILIGHSMGGLLTQLLVNRDLAAAGIAIHPVPPKGVIPYELSFYKGGSKSLGLFTSTKKTYLMSFKTWQYAFTNGMSLADQKEAYEKSVIPESKLVSRDGLSSAAKIDFKKSHAPLLIISGSTDHIIPATLNYRNYKAYKNNNGSITDYKEFKGKNHYVLGLPTWKEEANYILNWIDTH